MQSQRESKGDILDTECIALAYARAFAPRWGMYDKKESDIALKIVRHRRDRWWAYAYLTRDTWQIGMPFHW